MIRKISKNEIRERVHVRIRKKLRGTTERPRLTIFRSTAHIYAQVIDDSKGVTLVAANIRALRKPDPYKNKGVRYTGEALRKKAGKTGAGAKGK